jgi:hypothetical protein
MYNLLGLLAFEVAGPESLAPEFQKIDGGWADVYAQLVLLSSAFTLNPTPSKELQEALAFFRYDYDEILADDPETSLEDMIDSALDESIELGAMQALRTCGDEDDTSLALEIIGKLLQFIEIKSN